MPVTRSKDLLDRVSGSEIRYFEVSARRRDGFDDDGVGEEDSPDSPTMEFFSAHSEDALITRLRMSLDHPKAWLVVDGAVRFTWDAPVEYAENVVHEFVERVGVPYVYPYLRVLLADLAVRIDIGPINLPPLRMDTLRLRRSVSDGETAVD